MKTLALLLPILMLLMSATSSPTAQTASTDGLPPRPWTIAHRGASAYAPENTVAAFELAVTQGATFVEIDIQRTKDGQIVILHDLTLERTTDVEERYPDRARPAPDDPKKTPRWWLDDFTLAELQRLDAGSWFDPTFAGVRIPTFDETIRSVRGRSGLFIELKSPERYPGIEAEMIAVLERHGLHRPGADARTPIMLQSFTVPSIERLAAMRTPLRLVVLVAARDADRWLSRDGVDQIRRIAGGISPEKPTLATHAEGWRHATERGLPITPWTFRSTAVKDYPNVTEEMRHYLRAGVAGLITDNPDLAPR